MTIDLTRTLGEFVENRAAGAVTTAPLSGHSSGYNPPVAEQPEHSGQFRVRVPSELHTALVHEAARQGVSLNTLVVAILAGAVGWRQPTAAASPED